MRLGIRLEEDGLDGLHLDKESRCNQHYVSSSSLSVLRECAFSNLVALTGTRGGIVDRQVETSRRLDLGIPTSDVAGVLEPQVATVG